MSQDKFDVIVVGAGPAGSTAAYMLAGAGKEVLLIERGDAPGSKNMTGGRLYGHSLEQVMPGFAKEAPVERKIVKEVISFLTPDTSVSLDLQSQLLLGSPKESYSVLRAEFDRWLAEKAEEAGACLVPGIRVDDLYRQNGRVAGVIAGEDTMEADVVILADGVNSLLAQKAGLKTELKPHQVAVGAKEIIELPEDVIEDRFSLNQGEGASRLFVGDCTKGKIGGGFLYTNRNSISLGVVCTLSDLPGSEKTVPEMVEEFKQHPAVRPLVKGGKTVEYSGHLVTEAGYGMLPKLYADGVLVAGDAAGFVINIGYMVRGMDLAIASGEAAAQAIISAQGDHSAHALSRYRQLLDQSFVMRDLKQYRKFPAFMENHRIFQDYPKLAEELMTDLFSVDGAPAPSLIKRVLGPVKKVGLFKVAGDVWKGGKALS
ncbi:FAD-dependent oxidoreductase [Candidatus Formimonas warabiya]|uniref:Oxidoreductase n=1 Tax=Formimonas warabiya TaxID=1761012 RepID=A0A3G1KYE8_FORW1|nr:FAD-dependent oxidoreductase [Candidatus Formimonas warabiya]ATW27498.1 oxidoreductase [Candidatus Formimonas warabiya]